MTDQYFAKQPTDKIGTVLKQKIDRYYIFMSQSGIFRRQYRSQCHYYGISPGSNAQTDMIRSGGKAGQLAMVKVNHYRNLAQHLIQLTTAQKPSPQPIAANSDAKSQKQVTLAKGILDYYSREKRIERFLRDAAEYAVTGSEGFVETGWESDQSDKDGDIHLIALPSCEVIRDPNKQNFNELDWVITRKWNDKYLVADKWAPEEQIPQDASGFVQQDPNSIRQKILNQQTKMEYDRMRLPMVNWMLNAEMFGQSQDIAVYHFWHKRSPSLPNGRYVICVQDGTVLFDGDLPYRDIPVRRITTGDLQGTSFGYSPMFDLLVLQQAIDALYTAVATNQMTFGVQLIMAMKGSDIDYKQLARGLSFIQYSDPNGKPEALNLTHTPAQVFQFIQQLEKTMETISGVNAVVRGDPPESLKSGSALALVQAQAITFSSGLQQSYAHLVQDVYTDMINIMKEYANNKKVISIVGKYNRSMLVDFLGSDVSEINRVVVNIASPLEQTVPGRMQIAQDLIQAKLLTKPQEYLNVIKTGNLDPLIEGDHAQLILIRSENESIASGQPVSAMVTDDHSLHIREHKAILATPEARTDPALVQLATEHMMEHIRFLSDPMIAPLLSVLGQQTMQMPQPQGQLPGAPSQPSGQGNQPRLPTNPATKQPWNPQDGGNRQGPMDPGNPTGGAGGGGAA